MKPHLFKYEHIEHDGSINLIFYNQDCIIKEWLVNIGFHNTTVDIKDTMDEKYPEVFKAMEEIVAQQFAFNREAKADEESA